MGDWNWFFSSVAQSVAAIVGVTASFITVRLLTNEANFARRSARTRELLDEGERLADDAERRRFDWYNRWQNELAYASLQASISIYGRLKPIDIYTSFNFSPYSSAGEVLAEIATRIDTPGDDAGWPQYTTETVNNLRPRLEEERERIDAVLASCKHHARVIAWHISESEWRPEVSPIMNVAIAATLVLFYIGVIGPLSFLPVTQNRAPMLSFVHFVRAIASLPGAILTICAFIFTAGCVAAWRLNRSLYLDHFWIHMLKEYSDYTRYSRFFQTLHDNETKISEKTFGEA